MTAALSPPEEYSGKCGKTSAEIRSKFALLKSAATRKFRRSYAPMRANVSTSRKKNAGRARPTGLQSGFHRPPVRPSARSFRRSSNWPKAAKMRDAKYGEKKRPAAVQRAACNLFHAQGPSRNGAQILRPTAHWRIFASPSDFSPLFSRGENVRHNAGNKAFCARDEDSPPTVELPKESPEILSVITAEVKIRQ